MGNLFVIPADVIPTYVVPAKAGLESRMTP
jgi:hypothetical protein